MRKLIHSEFELDLSGFELSDNEENNWFSDSFFSKYSFPFEIDIAKDFDIASGFISQINSSNIVTYFDVKYVFANKIEEAILEIESYQNRLSCVLRYGFEQLPSFDKKLSELSLDKFILTGAVNDHAETIITKTWPEVNYNFPQIHTDKLNPEDELWVGFEKIINNRKNGVFLKNDVSLSENISFNRNIIQPYPYLNHVLQRGMIDSGFVLSGDILTDEILKNAVLINLSNYFTVKTIEDINIVLMGSEYFENVGSGQLGQMGKYQKIISFTKPGKYLIQGTIKTRSVGSNAPFPPSGHIYLNSTQIWTSPGTLQNENIFDINLEFQITNINDTLTIRCYSQIIEGYEVFNLNIINLFEFDSNGNPIPTVSFLNEIDLQKSVPNILFADLIKCVKNWFNYDLEVIGKNAFMNKIESKITYNNAISLEGTEVKYPLKKFQQGISFLLKFQEVENTSFNFLPVYQNRHETLYENFKTDEKTVTIEIIGLPLPVVNKNGATTAYAFEDNDSKVYLVKYNGLTNGNNYTLSETEMLLPNVHMYYWKKWFDFRIKSISFTWSLKYWIEKMFDLTPKKIIFAYNKFHIIKTINKTEVRPDLFEIEIETETLE